MNRFSAFLFLSAMAISTSALAAQENTLELFGNPLQFEAFGIDSAQQKQLNQQLRVEVGLFEQLDKELQQLNATGVVHHPSAYLVELLALCDSWEKKTEQAFTCKLGGLQNDWTQAADKKELPDRSELRKKTRIFLQQNWVANAAEISLTDSAKKSGFKISSEGLLHAFVLDKTIENLTAFSAKKSINLQSLHLGFDKAQRCWRKTASSIPSSNPSSNQCVVNRTGVFLNSPLVNLAAANNAVVTIDSNQDLQRIGSYSLSKILIPKEGWPVEFAPSVMVVATDAVTAAVSARALVVKPIAAGVQWINSQSAIEALVMTDTGTVFPSKGWYSLLIPDAEHQPLWSGEKQFLIEYQTLEQQVAEYRRPYAALWITNSEKQLVRQLVVHGDNLRWLKEIPLWWRRYGRNNEQTVDGLARATTPPGSHMLVWDGRDDKGNKVPKGHYVLNIEAAREHGEHELVSLAFELSGQSFNVHAAGEKELGQIKVSFSAQP